jgi:hypothetical protein
LNPTSFALPGATLGYAIVVADAILAGIWIRN